MVVIMLVIFLKMVTMGTELCCRDAMPVKSMAQKKILTGAHSLAVANEKLGYSTHLRHLQNSTAMTATMA